MDNKVEINGSEYYKYICPECQRHRATYTVPIEELDKFKLRCDVCNDAFEHDVQMVPATDKCIVCSMTVYEEEYCRRCRPDHPGQKTIRQVV